MLAKPKAQAGVAQLATRSSPAVAWVSCPRPWGFPSRIQKMQNISYLICALVLSVLPAFAQAKRLWILRPSGEIIEYDPATFSSKQTVKLPPEAIRSPQNVAINHLGQILFAPEVALPMLETDFESPHKLWFWNGQSATTIDQGVKHETAATGSNQAVTEIAPAVYLSSDGTHLFWFANQERRLQREEIDLSVTTTWQAWQTDLSGSAREDLTSLKFPDCSCPSGACEESCPAGVVWVPEEGVGNFFLMTQFSAGKDEPSYKATARYQQEAGKWAGHSFPDPLRRVLGASEGGDILVEAIPDTGCCGWSNQSDDRTVVLTKGKTQPVFDEQATYKNVDYDVSFYTSSARLSPDLASVAMTIVSTAQANKPIQLSEQGQANPEESKQIRRALTELPAVEIKSLEDTSRRIAFLPHTTLVGWINDKELLIVEDHLLVAYHLGTGARRKSNVRVEDAARVFLR